MLGIDTVRSHRRAARRPVGPRVRVHARRRRTPTCCAPRAKRGIRAAFVTSAGYGEAGDDGRRAEARARRARRRARHPARRARTGRASCRRRRSLCAQIVAPYPPPGRIAIASQSGNFVSSFQNWAVQTGVGVSRAVSAGNAAAVGDRRLPRVLRRRRSRDRGEPRVRRGRHRRPRAVRAPARTSRARKPVVLVKGGTTSGGERAAASHTGSLASDDRVFDGHVPPGRHHARRDDRGSVRGGGDVRDAAAARGPAYRGAHDRGRMGRRDRRRDRADRARSSSRRCPTTCAPRSTRSCRRAGAATTRSTSRAARRATRSPR